MLLMKSSIVLSSRLKYKILSLSSLEETFFFFFFLTNLKGKLGINAKKRNNNHI